MLNVKDEIEELDMFRRGYFNKLFHAKDSFDRLFYKYLIEKLNDVIAELEDLAE